MPRKHRIADTSPGPDWFLSEWMAAKNLRAAQIVRETDWGKATVSDIVNGKTHYRRELVNALARVLKIEPWELLMHPDEANQILRLRAAVAEEAHLRAVAEERREFKPAEEPGERLLPRRNG